MSQEIMEQMKKMAMMQVKEAKEAKEAEKQQAKEEKQKEKEAKQKEKEAKEADKQKEKEAKKEEKQKAKEEEDTQNALKEMAKQEKQIKEEKDKKQLQNVMNEEYAKMKIEVEKYWFFLKDLGKFVMFDKDNNKFIMHSDKTTKLNLAKYRLNCGKNTQPFFDKWMADETRREYDSIIFNPKSTSTKDFNTFSGYKYDNCANPNKSTVKIHNFLNHLFTEEQKKYMMDWLSIIINQKDKTNVAVILYSNTHGCGKNTFIELVRKLIDDKYISKLENIDELSSEFTGRFENKMFIYGDEILAKKNDLYLSIKNAITRSQVCINRKGVEAYDIDNFASFLFTTNERISMKLEKNCRRLTVFNVSETPMTLQQSTEIYDAMDDEDIIKSFYHEILKNNKIKEIKCMNTELKREMQNAYISSPIKFLFKNYKRLEGTKYSNIELFDQIRNYEKNCAFTELKTVNQMSAILKEVHDFTYKNNTLRGYKFDNLEKILKQYDAELFADYEIDYTD